MGLEHQRALSEGYPNDRRVISVIPDDSETPSPNRSNNATAAILAIG